MRHFNISSCRHASESLNLSPFEPPINLHTLNSQCTHTASSAPCVLTPATPSSTGSPAPLCATCARRPRRGLLLRRRSLGRRLLLRLLRRAAERAEGRRGLLVVGLGEEEEARLGRSELLEGGGEYFSLSVCEGPFVCDY